MKEKKKMSLLLKLVIAIVLGIVVGFVTPGMGAFGEVIIRIGATYNSIFGNFLNFVIPLIIIGFVAPGIADLGAGAGKTLAATTGVAYGSTIISGTLAFVVASLLYPHMVHAGMFMENAANAEETVLAGYFNIEMPPIMGVMTALLTSWSATSSSPCCPSMCTVSSLSWLMPVPSWRSWAPSSRCSL